jgi:hypothetical protein
MKRNLDAIYDLLYEHCKAPWGLKNSFIQSFSDHSKSYPKEFRYQGNMGFGGKIYMDGTKIWIGCYKEDETPERLATICKVNEILREF